MNDEVVYIIRLWISKAGFDNQQTWYLWTGQQQINMKLMSGITACHNMKFNSVFKIYDIKTESWIMPEELDMFELQQQTKNCNNPFPPEMRRGIILSSSEYFKVSVLVNDYTWRSCVTYKYCPPAINLSNPLIDVSAFASRLTFPSFCFKNLPLKANELYMGSEVPTLEKSDRHNKIKMKKEPDQIQKFCFSGSPCKTLI